MLGTSIFFSLLLSALFSGSEIAFISANKLKIELKKKKGARRGSILAGFYDRPADFLGTMLVGNNIALVIFTIQMTALLIPYLSPIITNSVWLLLVNTVLITIVVLIFGEFLPKTLFRLYADDILYSLAYPLRFFQLILSIPALATNKLSNWILKWLFKTPPETVENVFTRLDLENFVLESKSDESDEIDKELFGKALNLKELRARDIMIPRTEMEHIDVNKSVQDLEDLIRETKLSRIILTEDGDIDNVLGYVHHQQLLRDPKSIWEMKMDITFIPESMHVPDLMRKFIQNRLSIACIVDEFGGIAGVITLEDILEELFGEIEDEHDQEEYLEQKLSEEEYIFSGRLEIDYLNEKYPELNLPDGEYQTLSGYLVTTTETIPEQGAEIELENKRFILELVSDTKIETIRVVILEEEED